MITRVLLLHCALRACNRLIIASTDDEQETVAWRVTTHSADNAFGLVYLLRTLSIGLRENQHHRYMNAMQYLEGTCTCSDEFTSLVPFLKMYKPNSIFKTLASQFKINMIRTNTTVAFRCHHIQFGRQRRRLNMLAEVHQLHSQVHTNRNIQVAWCWRYWVSASSSRGDYTAPLKAVNSRR